MNADLAATIDELGPEYRDVVRRLRAPFEPPVKRCFPWRAGYLVAASLLAAVAMGWLCLRDSGEAVSQQMHPDNEYTLAFKNSEAAFDEILRTQQSDGGWGNDFLTRQNVAALRASGDPRARIAVKRGMRRLRFEGKVL